MRTKKQNDLFNEAVQNCTLAITRIIVDTGVYEGMTCLASITASVVRSLEVNGCVRTSTDEAVDQLAGNVKELIGIMREKNASGPPALGGMGKPN